ncbi:MAG: hypothetical protein JJV89_01895 [Desulfosarcina sp.]|nr:hypothetical protein [Desulfobacterales bacterium]
MIQKSLSHVAALDIRSSGYAVETPFKVKIDDGNRVFEIVCCKALRILPGKRLVCFGIWNGKRVVVKFFLDPARGPKHCEREKNGLSALCRAGIKTPALLLKGTLQQDSMPILIIEKLEPAENLEVLWKQCGSYRQRRELLEKMIHVIACQHEIGIKQDDIHLANFMMYGGQIYTIDGDAVDSGNLGTPLPVAASLKNLGLFLSQFYPEFDKLIDLIFLQYISKRSISFMPDADRCLKKEVKFYRKYKKKKYLKKIFRECSAFVCKKNRYNLVIYDRKYHSAQMDTFLANPDIFFKPDNLLKSGNTSTVAMAEIDGKKLVIKRYNVKNLWHSFKYLFRKSRASVSWKNAQKLFYLLNIPTPKPVAFVEKRLGFFKKKSYFITEYIDGIEAHHLFYSDKVDDSSRKKIADLFGKLLQSLSDACLSHGDFKDSNFIIAREKLFLLDLDAMQEHRFRWIFRKKFNRDCRRLLQNCKNLPELEELFKKQINRLQL